MRSLTFLAPGQLRIDDVPEPTLVEPLVRPLAATTCDLDHRVIADKTPFSPFGPFPLGSVPEHLVASLTAAAKRSEQLDQEMERLHSEVRGGEDLLPEDDDLALDEEMLLRLWRAARSDADRDDREAR